MQHANTVLGNNGTVFKALARARMGAMQQMQGMTSESCSHWLNPRQRLRGMSENIIKNTPVTDRAIFYNSVVTV